MLAPHIIGTRTVVVGGRKVEQTCFSDGHSTIRFIPTLRSRPNYRGVDNYEGEVRERRRMFERLKLSILEAAQVACGD